MIHTYLIKLILKQVNQETLLKSLLLNKQCKQVGTCLIKDFVTIDLFGKIKKYTRDRSVINLQKVRYIDADSGLFGACLGGHSDLVGWLIKKGASYWNFGLKAACMGGHLKIIELMIEYGANNWDWGLYGACIGGKKDIVNLMIAKGANNWNQGLRAACQGGNRKIAELMIDKGAVRWDYGIAGSCKGGHADLARWMVDLGTDYCPNCYDLSRHTTFVD